MASRHGSRSSCGVCGPAVLLGHVRPPAPRQSIALNVARSPCTVLNVTETPPSVLLGTRLEFSSDPNAVDQNTGVLLPIALHGCPRCLGDHIEPLGWRHIIRPIGFLGLTGRPAPPSMPPQFFALCPNMAEPILYTNITIGPIVL